jgi:hypothetical protein
MNVTAAIAVFDRPRMAALTNESKSMTAGFLLLLLVLSP